MIPQKKLARWGWALLILILLSLVTTASVYPKFRMGLAIMWAKSTGSLPDVGWADLFTMARSKEHYNLPSLAKTLNPYATIRNPYKSPEDIAAGKEEFRSHCETCHGANGLGGPGGPPLTHGQMRHGNGDWTVFESISKGIHGTAMPASQLPWLDRWRLVTFVQSISPNGEGEMASTSDPEGVEVGSVPYETIREAERTPAQWLTYSGSYDGHRNSSLSQITPANAGGLRLLWMRQYDTTDPSIETSPLVVGNYMFVTAPPNRVEALDAKSGATIWSYERQLPEKLSLCCGYANRGLAVLGQTLFLGTLDAHLVALDIKTGQVRWDAKVADSKAGYSITSAPLAIKNLVITGVAGGEFGIRGFVEAFDAQTGKEVWKFYTVPEPGQTGAETWEEDSWKTGGASTWLTGSFDPETNTIYWPVGNPSPDFEGDSRDGDNLYSNCVVALDADRGTLHWHFQFTPHDLFDWDATEILVLFDKTVEGKRKKYLAQANRNGFYYLIDRETGKFAMAKAFVKETWANGVDSNGRPRVNPNTLPTPRGTTVYPGVVGATNWESPTYSPQTGWIYVPGLERGAIFYKNHSNFHAGDLFLGGSYENLPDERPQGAIRALDAQTGEQKWEFRNPAAYVGGLLSTEGGIIFGSQQDTFYALDAKSGHELWRVETHGRIVAAPITYMNGGKQMVTVAAGHDIITFGL